MGQLIGVKTADEREYFEQVHKELDELVDQVAALTMQLGMDYEDAKSGDIPGDSREIKWREKLAAKVDLATMRLDEAKVMISDRMEKSKEGG